MPIRARRALRSMSGSMMFCPSIITLPVGALTGIEIVHAVQHPQQGRLAAARRADHARDLPVGQFEVDPLQRAVLP